MKTLISLLWLILLCTFLFAGANEKMSKAYKLSKGLVSERLVKEDKVNKELLEDINKADLVVVQGTYDHIHLVLEHLDMPFVEVSSYQLQKLDLNPDQTVFVNCAQGFPAESARKLAGFVEAGGQLITTDWALLNVLEVGFPGYVSYNKRPTSDEVVSVEVAKKDPVISGFLDEKTEPVWWLEGSSYPIKVLNAEKVEVLIRSRELKKKYGEDAVIVKFEHGQGVVYHMISHFYLQRTETRDKKHSMSAAEYSKDKGASKEEQEKWEAAKDLKYGDVQSANTSSEFLMRTIIEQKKRVKNRKK